jgi:hypothetical protein
MATFIGGYRFESFIMATFIGIYCFESCIMATSSKSFTYYIFTYTYFLFTCDKGLKTVIPNKSGHDTGLKTVNPNKSGHELLPKTGSDTKPGFLEKNLSLYLSFCSDSKKYLS